MVQGLLVPAHLCVAVGNQRDVHDVTEQQPGGKQHLTEEVPAAGTQRLVVQTHLDRTWSLTGPGEVSLQTLLQDLQRPGQTRTRLLDLHRPGHDF